MDACFTHEAGAGAKARSTARKLGGFPERLRTFQKICEAVSFAHARHVLHRDLKPQNIMVGPFGEVLVMDWGLAKLLDLQACWRKKTSFRRFAGPRLRLPGQTHLMHKAPRPIQRMAWFWHARLHGAGTGARRDRSSRAARGHLLARCSAEISDRGLRRTPKALAAIAGKAMAEDAQQSYGSVEELAHDIAHYLDGAPVSAYPEGAMTQMWRWMVKNSAWLLLILAYLVMRALFILWRAR